MRHIFREELGEKMVDTHVVGDFMKMLHFLKKLDRNQRKKEYYEMLYREQHKIVRKQYGHLCFK